LLDTETGGIAQVRCSRCGQYLGRVQVVPPEGEDADAWGQEVQGELDLLTDEHEPECRNPRPAAG
jgi:hypothetical protein